MDLNKIIGKPDWFSEAGLLIVLFASLSIAYNSYFVTASYYLPSYDNSMLHAGRARVIIETGRYAENEVVFGGGTPTYHVFVYPALVAGTSLLTGLDFAWAERLVGLVIALLLPFGYYLLSKCLFRDWRAGVASGLLVLFTPVFMQWATRNSPISIGNALVPLALFFILRREHALAAFCAAILAFDHPPSLLVLCFSALFFAIAEFLELILARNLLQKALFRPLEAVRAALSSLFPEIAAGLAGFFAYMAWHIRQTGASCLDFSCLPQRAAHEFGAPVPLFDYFSKNPHFFSIAGLLILPFYKKSGSRGKLLVASYFLANVILVKNDLLGIATFTERFVTYLGGAAAVLGGLAVSWFFSLVRGDAD